MNPLRLDKTSRKFYEALVDLYHTDIDEGDIWLDAYRRVKRIRKAEGTNIVPGWKLFYINYMPPGGLPLGFAEKIFREKNLKA